MAMLAGPKSAPIGVSPLGLVMAVAVIALLTGCGNTMDHGGMNMSPMAGPQSSKASLAPGAAAAGSGTATVALVKDQIHVDVRTTSLSPSAVYTVHLHQGTCNAIGSIIRTVGDVHTDASGSGTVHLEYSGTEVPAPAFVDVHAAGSTEGPDTCGDLKANL